MTATFQTQNIAEHQLKQTMAKLMDENQRDSALAITKKVTELSLTVARQKSKKLLENLPKEYCNNMEQQLWKTCFYNAIEPLERQY
uniref:Uncharacterized protein n=1 Tax=Ditylenchus dipsaci TaxID=166011 RepID=A0A915EUV9_9BILA